jgi:transposase
MKFRFRFTTATKTRLRTVLKKAYDRGDARLVRRISALMAYAQGQEVSAVAEALSVSPETVYIWLRAFLVDRFASLRYASTPGRPAYLTKTQKRRLKQLVNAGPLAYGFTRGCWSSLLIQELILLEFGVLYNRHYICELLKNLGYSYQKAKFVSAHLDPQARKQWLEETWPAILRKARRRNALLLFVDEASFPQWGTLSYTWGRRGHQPEVPTSGVRKAYKVFGAADALSGRLFYHGIEGRFNSDTYAQFLTQLMQQTKRHLMIIQDGARYHTSKATQAFFHTHRARLTCCQLPGYSPDFNPIEHLWQAVRDDATHNKYFPHFEDVMASVEDTLQFLVRHRSMVRKTLGDYATEKEIMPKAA